MNAATIEKTFSSQSWHFTHWVHFFCLHKTSASTKWISDWALQRRRTEGEYHTVTKRALSFYGGKSIFYFFFQTFASQTNASTGDSCTEQTDITSASLISPSNLCLSVPSVVEFSNSDTNVLKYVRRCPWYSFSSSMRRCCAPSLLFFLSETIMRTRSSSLNSCVCVTKLYRGR